MGTGQQFAKWLKPAGCVAVLVFTVIATALMFTARGTPVEGYEPAESGEYYSERPEDLLSELETNLLPKIEAPDVELDLSDGVIHVTGPGEQLHTARLAIIHYYDGDMFVFTEVTP